MLKTWLTETLLCADIARVLIALVLTVGTLGLLFTNTQVPDALWAFDGAAIGFYFGGLVRTVPTGGNLT